MSEDCNSKKKIQKNSPHKKINYSTARFIVFYRTPLYVYSGVREVTENSR